MMAEQAVYRRRVLVAFDPCEADAADFEASARLAAGLNAELVALLVEDSDLIAAADLPVTRLIPAGCRQLATLDAAAMRRAFRIAEGRARERFSSIAERWQLHWSFEVTEVRRTAETMARLRSEDVLTLTGAAVRGAVISRRAAAVNAERAPCPVMLLRREGRRGQPVSVLYQGDDGALSLGREFARVYDSPLLILVTGEDQAEQVEREASAKKWLAETGTPGVTQRVSTRTPESLGRILAEVDAGLVVVGRRAAGGKGLDLDALAEQTRASIVVLGIG